MTSKAKLFIFINILSVIKVSLLETVHFTNSPNKLFKATNYTTYKVEVPNGEPITIIEANQPLTDNKIKFDSIENAQKYSAHRNGDRRKQHVVDLESTLSMTVTPNRNYEYENSAAVASAGDEESVTNDYSNLSHERNQKRNPNAAPVMKTVYSPELLQKFLKDYVNKIQSIESSSQQQQQQHHHQQQYHQHLHSGSVELEQHVNEEENNKYASIETGDDDDTAASEDGNRRVSNAAAEDDDEKDSSELNDIQQRKNYRPNNGNYNSNHPYNKNNGWVTLDAVPWSKSKVSKWQSNVKRYGTQSQSNYNYQNGNNYNSRPPYRPTSGSNNNYDYDYNGGSSGGGNNDNDDYYASRPVRPTFHNNQYYSSRPPPPPPQPQQPQDNFYQSSHHYSSSSQHHNNNNNEYDHNRPSNRPEIITDNRPSNFPSHGEDHHNRPAYTHRPSYQHENAYHGGNYHSYKEGQLPQTYPHNGDGEWVLVSTTKGYQFPKRSGQRAMSFATQNGFNHNDNKGIITAAESQRVEHHLRPHRSGPTKMSQQQVKLTVLPLFVNGEQQGNRNNNQNHNDIDMSVYKPAGSQQQAYDGMIETAQSSQTVEESAANANNEANQVTTPNKTKKKRKVMKNYLMRKSSGGAADSTAMIAAVGASLLPASLGLIAPMVLG